MAARRTPRNMRRPKKKGMSITTQRRIVRGTILLVFAFMIAIFIFGDHGVYQLYKMHSQQKETHNRIEEMRAEQKVLLEEKKRLQTDLEYIERIAREKYRMAKKDEKVFKVIPKDDK